MMHILQLTAFQLFEKIAAFDLQKDILKSFSRRPLLCAANILHFPKLHTGAVNVSTPG